MGVFREKIFGTKFTHQFRPSDRKRAVNPLDHTNRRPSLHASTHVRPAAVPNSNEVAKAQRRGTLHLRGISSFRSNSKTGGDQWRVDTDAPGSTSLRPSTATSHPISHATANPRGRRRLHPLPHDRRSGPARFYSSTTTASSPSAKLPARREPSRSLPGPGRFRVSVSQRTTRPPVTCLSSSSRLSPSAPLASSSPPPADIYTRRAHGSSSSHQTPKPSGRRQSEGRSSPSPNCNCNCYRTRFPETDTAATATALRWRWPLPPRRPRPTTCPWHRRC